MTRTSIMQHLYDSEINFSISAFYDDGFLVQLGDEVSGYVAEGRLSSWADVETWLTSMLHSHYPDSLFARNG